MQQYWPILLIIGANTFYHICAKSVPGDIHPLASVTVTYLVGAAVSAVLYFILSPEKNLAAEYRHLNWAPFLFGVTIVGLEMGSIYMYKVGWNISIGSLIANIGLAVALLFVGWLFYKETVSLKQLLGAALCVGGLVLLQS